MYSGSGGLLTDLYQLTMGQAYFQRKMHATAVFELFIRKQPPTRRFLIAAGLGGCARLPRGLIVPNASRANSGAFA